MKRMIIPKMLELLKTPLNTVKDTIRLSTQKVSVLVARGIAQLWQKFYWARFRVSNQMVRRGYIAVLAVILLLIGTSAYFAPLLQRVLEPYFDQNRISVLRDLFLALGGALIGATAIAFSLVMFAMQVNVERMPYGLFRRFSTDARVLTAFVGTFLVAICVASASLIADRSRVAVAILASAWGIVLIFLFFLHAYRRALELINPLNQLNLMVKDVDQGMRGWIRRAIRATPLFKQTNSDREAEDRSVRSTHDLSRIMFFRANPHWTTGALRAIQHAISFARRYAEQGDHEVSGAALGAVVAINRGYVESKGKTFFGSHILIDNPFSTDGFINNTLEHLRQNIRVGISRGDEQQIEQTLRAMAGLVQVYVQIDYSNPHASKTHAHIAAGYLSDAVKTVVPHNMPDVLMEGIRLMGQSANLFVAQGVPQDIVALADEIGLVACLGAANEKYRPVTLTGVEQLATLTFSLIRADTHDISFAAGKLKENVALVAKLFLKVPDTPLGSIHSAYLAPYYSSTTTSSLLSWLTECANAIVEAKPDDSAAKTVIRNIEDWADELYRSEKDLLLFAVEKRSHFTFDVIHWIAHITKVLLVISNAPACDDHPKNELRKHALWLILTLSWIPDDKETVNFVENYRLSETLFDTAVDAYQRDCLELSEKARELLLGWGLKGGKHETGWTILERSLCGVATLALMKEDMQQAEDLKGKLTANLSKPDSPSQQNRDRAARELRKRTSTLDFESFSFSHVELGMRQVDHGRLRTLLEEIANILSPEKQMR